MAADDWNAIVLTLGTTVRDVRKLLGWTQQYVADHAGISQGLISRLERGESAAIPFHSVVVVLRTLAAGADAMHLRLSPIAQQLLSFAHMNGTLMTIDLPETDLAAIAQALRRIPRPRRAAFLSIVRAAAVALGDEDDAPPIENPPAPENDDADDELDDEDDDDDDLADLDEP
jgi:transcriptional regulator with XRE-family HTH domain